jgi:hypothetical protein
MGARSRQEARRPYQRSGFHTLKKAIVTLGSRALPPKRTALGRALREWRAALVADLGGADAISTQQAALVDLAVTTKLQLDSVDAFLFSMPSPVDKRHRRLWPVVRERQVIAGQLRDVLRDLGLDRKAKPVPDLAAYLAERTRQPAPSEAGS